MRKKYYAHCPTCEQVREVNISSHSKLVKKGKIFKNDIVISICKKHNVKNAKYTLKCPDCLKFREVSYTGFRNVKDGVGSCGSCARKKVQALKVKNVKPTPKKKVVKREPKNNDKKIAEKAKAQKKRDAGRPKIDGTDSRFITRVKHDKKKDDLMINKFLETHTVKRVGAYSVYDGVTGCTMWRG